MYMLRWKKNCIDTCTGTVCFGFVVRGWKTMLRPHSIKYCTCISNTQYSSSTCVKMQFVVQRYLVNSEQAGAWTSLGQGYNQGYICSIESIAETSNSAGGFSDHKRWPLWYHFYNTCTRRFSAETADCGLFETFLGLPWYFLSELWRKFVGC